MMEKTTEVRPFFEQDNPNSLQSSPAFSIVWTLDVLFQIAPKPWVMMEFQSIGGFQRVRLDSGESRCHPTEQSVVVDRHVRMPAHSLFDGGVFRRRVLKTERDDGGRNRIAVKIIGKCHAEVEFPVDSPDDMAWNPENRQDENKRPEADGESPDCPEPGKEAFGPTDCREWKKQTEPSEIPEHSVEIAGRCRQSAECGRCHETTAGKQDEKREGCPD